MCVTLIASNLVQETLYNKRHIQHTMNSSNTLPLTIKLTFNSLSFSLFMDG